MRQAIENLENVRKLKGSTKWKFEGENKLGNKVWTLEDDDSGCRAVKGEAKVGFNPETIFYQLSDLSDASLTQDSILSTVKLVEKLGQNTYLCYGLTNKVGPISPRDLLMVVHANFLDDGTIVSTMYSIEDQ